MGPSSHTHTHTFTHARTHTHTHTHTYAVVLNNLGQGSFLTWVRLALVADMMVSYPVMLSSSREICESALLGSFASSASKEGGMMERLQAIDWQDLLARNAVRSGLILSAFAIAQVYTYLYKCMYVYI